MMDKSSLLAFLNNTTGRQRRRLLIAALSLLSIIGLAGSFSIRGDSPDNPHRLLDTLRIATHLPDSSREPDRPSSSFNIEMDLAHEFAEKFDWEIKVIHSRDREHSLDLLTMGDADLAITGSIEPGNDLARKFRAVITREVSLQLIGLQGPASAPFSLAELAGKTIAVIADTPAADYLESQHFRYPGLSIEPMPRATSGMLLEQVMDTQIQYALLQSDEFLVLQHIYPELIERLALPGLFPVGWVTLDRSPLTSLAETFVRDFKSSGRFQRLVASHHEHLWDFNYTEASTFLAAVRQKLPDYEILFKSAGEDFELDWQLLAAMAWQESHWNPEARSATGVRGMMMLTQTTAEEMQVTDRLDAAQSIHGGARYLADLIDRLPDDIPEHEKQWFGLASYNIGFGHVTDAINLAKSLGDQVETWQTLKTYLPLLADPKWSDRTRYGTARGHEPVLYVKKTRQFYDIIRWINSRQFSANSAT